MNIWTESSNHCKGKFFTNISQRSFCHHWQCFWREASGPLSLSASFYAFLPGSPVLSLPCLSLQLQNKWWIQLHNWVDLMVVFVFLPHVMFFRYCFPYVLASALLVSTFPVLSFFCDNLQPDFIHCLRDSHWGNQEL